MKEVVEMSFEQFKSRCEAGYAGYIGYREVGKYGWTSVEDILDRKAGGNPGPHYTDAYPMPSGSYCYLRGTYDHNTNIATFYNR